MHERVYIYVYESVFVCIIGECVYVYVYMYIRASVCDCMCVCVRENVSMYEWVCDIQGVLVRSDAS